MIDLLLVSVDEMLDAGDRVRGSARGEGARQLVSRSDRIASDARHRAVDQRRTLAGRLALRLLASARLGRDLRLAAELDVNRTCDRCGAHHGQPRIGGLSASTSTSEGVVLAAIGDPGARVGVDVERMRDALWPGFDEYVLHPDERPAALSDEGVSHRIRVWTEKEAALKGAGLGLRAAPAHLRVSTVETPRESSEGRGFLDPGAWRPVDATHVHEVSGTWVTTIEGDVGAWSALAAASPQSIRRWGVRDLVPARVPRS